MDLFVLTLDHLDDVVVVTACNQSSVHLHNSQCSSWWHVSDQYTTKTWWTMQSVQLIRFLKSTI